MSQIVDPDHEDNVSDATLPEAHRADAELAELANTKDLVAFRAEKVGVLRTLGKTFASSAVEIGRHLSEVKATFGRGDNPEFLAWAHQALGWKKSSVYNFLNAHELASTGKFSNGLENFDPSALFLLAAPGTPAEAIDAVAKRSGEGERLSRGEVKTVIAEAKGQATGVRNRAPVPPPLKLVAKLPPSRDQIEIVTGELIDQYCDDKGYLVSKVATALGVAPSVVHAALKTIRGDCVSIRRIGNETEFRISRDGTAGFRSMLAAKGEEIAAKDAEIADLKATIADLKATIADLKRVAPAALAVVR